MNFQTKKIFIKVVATVVVLSLALPALAATTGSTAPAQTSVTVGKVFDVQISVNPQGGKDFAEKVVLSYPADMLEVASFNFAPNWMPLTQTGYDTVDNQGGSITKTAGYPSGITAQTLFGTVTFKAKKAGTATIAFGNGTSFQSAGQTALSGSGSSITVAALATPSPSDLSPSPSPMTKVDSTSVKTTVVDKTSSNSNTASDQTTAGALETASANQVAAVGSANTTASSGGFSWWWLAALVIVAAGLYWAYKRYSKASNSDFMTRV